MDAACKNFIDYSLKLDYSTEKREVFNEALQNYGSTFKEAFEIGMNSRSAILKNTSNIAKATIGLQEYSSEEIERIKRCEPSKKISDLKLMHVVVEDINSADENNLTLVLKEKETQVKFKAKFDTDDNDTDFTDEEDDTLALGILWNSARYKRYFWAKIALSIKNDKIVRANLLEVADNKADLEPAKEDTI